MSLGTFVRVHNIKIRRRVDFLKKLELRDFRKVNKSDFSQAGFVNRGLAEIRQSVPQVSVCFLGVFLLHGYTIATECADDA